MNNCNKCNHDKLLKLKANSNRSLPLPSIILSIIVALLPLWAFSEPLIEEVKKVTLSKEATYDFDLWLSQGQDQPPLKSIKTELKKIETLDSQLKEWHQRQDRLNRIELEQIKTGLTHYIQLKILQLSQKRHQQHNAIEYLQIHVLCFYTLAEMAYSQSDIESLELIHQLRLWLLRELSFATQSPYFIKNIKNPTDLTNPLAAIRLPWPVDRILTTQMQSTPFLYKEQKRAKEAITALQKNPHIAVAEYFKQKNIFLTPQLKQWSNHWTSEHVKMMQTEISSYQSIKLALASLIFKQRLGKWPKSQENLIKEDLLEQLLIDPLTQYEQSLPHFK